MNSEGRKRKKTWQIYEKNSFFCANSVKGKEQNSNWELGNGKLFRYEERDIRFWKKDLSGWSNEGSDDWGEWENEHLSHSIFGFRSFLYYFRNKESGEEVSGKLYNPVRRNLNEFGRERVWRKQNKKSQDYPFGKRKELSEKERNNWNIFIR